jgi:hypothetical protein
LRVFVQFEKIALVAASSGTRAGFALLVDVVGSSDAPDFVRRRDRGLGRLSQRHREAGWIRAPYTVTAWDEFQTFLWEPGAVARVILELRQGLAPWPLRIGVGAGGIRGWRSRRPINEAVGGPAFERAREALEALEAGSGDKYPRLTRFRTGERSRDRLLDLVYGLHDTLVRDVTERQWETIGAALGDESQEEVARRLGVQPSTVSRNLQRGHYWQMRETADVVATLLAG